MTGPDELPILVELEQAFAKLVRAELDGVTATGAGDGHLAPAPAPVATTETPAPGRPPAPRRAPRSAVTTGRRILARALAAGALAGVVGATALATKSVVGSSKSDAPQTVQRADGHELTLRRYHGRWCLDITYAGGIASRCVAPPADGGVAPLSAVVPRVRLVVGLTGPDVLRVAVRRSGRTATASTHAIRGSELRWFTAELDAVPHEARHAAVVDPSPVGRAVADCTLGTAASCRAAREHSGVRM